MSDATGEVEGGVTLRLESAAMQRHWTKIYKPVYCNHTHSHIVLSLAYASCILRCMVCRHVLPVSRTSGSSLPLSFLWAHSSMAPPCLKSMCCPHSFL